MMSTIYKKIIIATLLMGSTISLWGSVQITSMDDVAFGSVSAVPGSSTFDVCIFSNNTGSRRYNITATSANPSGNLFRMKNGASNYLTYAMAYCVIASCSYANLSHNVTITGLTGGNSSQTCSGSTNIRFRVTVDSTSFSSAISGAYSDTLSIIIGPS